MDLDGTVHGGSRPADRRQGFKLQLHQLRRILGQR